MAYQYDEMGNIIGEYESEEERKAREEAANAEIHKQEVKTYGDGSQTVTSTQEIPAQAVAPSAQPTAAPMPQAAPVRAIAATPMQGQGGAISPEQMAYTQRMESGNQPNIGYHYAPGAEGQRTSTAYGAYGLTAPAYQDVQRANPAFAGRDITTLSPQEQQQAMQTYTGLNAQSLQRQGVEPSEGNVRLAHFLGAKGAADYLNSGTISPAAAAANGGEDRARQIAQQRLVGGNAPASGAALQPVAPEAGAGRGMVNPPMVIPEAAPSPADQSVAAYTAIQDNPIDLLKFRADTSQPDWLREWAGNQASDLMKQEIDKKKAEKQATTLIAGAAQGDRKASNQIAQTLTSQDGSWLKMILLGFISPQMAGEEAIKLGFGNKTAPAMNAAGESGLIQYNAKGDPLQGTKSNGAAMSREELYSYASQGVGKAADVSLTPHQAVVDGEVHTISTKRTAQGVQYRDDTAGTGWTTKAPAGLTNVGTHNPQEMQGLKTKQQIEAKMRKDNTSAVGATGRPIYSEEQIASAGNQAYTSLTGKPFAGAAPAAAPTTGPVAPGAMPQAAAQIPPPQAVAAAAVANAPAAPAAPAANAPKTIAQQILDYEVAPPTGPTTPAKLAIQNEVNRLAAEQGKTFNGGNFKIASTFNNSQSGKALKSINVAVDHLDTLQAASTELQNGQTPAFNKIANLYAANTGGTAPGNFNALKEIVGSEVAKAAAGGATALGDREGIRKELDNAKTPEQLAGIIGKYQALMAGQAKGIKNEWMSNGLDEKRFDDKLLSRTKFVLNKNKEPSRSNW